jgi:chromosome segregation ATPase
MTITAERLDEDGDQAGEQAGEQVRTCAYQKCGQPLMYDGRGRPPEYCSDRRWAQGRFCKQMAAADRAAERASGLEVPLETFRTAGERLVNVASPLARQLTELVSAIQSVQDGALSRIAEAERSAAESSERAQAAESRAQRAERACQAAEADQQRSEEAAEQAQRQAEQARREADEATQRAWQQVAGADHARGRAEAATESANRAHADEADRRRAAEQRATDVEAQLHGVRQQLDTERATSAQLRDQLHAAQARVERVEADGADLRRQLERLAAALKQRTSERDEAHQRAGIAEEQARAATDSERGLRTEVARLCGELDRLGRDLTVETQRAQRAEGRLDELIAVLELRPT